MSNLIDRQLAIDMINARLSQRCKHHTSDFIQGMKDGYCRIRSDIERLPPAQPEYKPVTAEDFAKTMSENTLYGFMAWHGEAFTLIKEMGFEICKKTM